MPRSTPDAYSTRVPKPIASTTRAAAPVETRNARGAASCRQSAAATPISSSDTAVFAFICGAPGTKAVMKDRPVIQPSSPTAPSAAPIRHRTRPASAARRPSGDAPSGAGDAP